MTERYPDADMVQLSIHVRREQLEVIESIQKASRQDSRIWDLSKSQAARELLEAGLDCLDENPDLEELVDGQALERYRKQLRHEERKREAEKEDILGGWRGRVANRLNARLAGPEPYRPVRIEQLAESYLGDMRDWAEDPETVEDHEEWMDQQLEQYRRAYDAKEITPDRDLIDQADDRVSLGADLWQLSQDPDTVLADLIGAVESEHSDPDAIVSKLAKEHGVDDQAIWTLLDKLTAEDTDSRQLLTGQPDRPAELIDPQQSQLIDPSMDPDTLATDPEAGQDPVNAEYNADPDYTGSISGSQPGISDGGIVQHDPPKSDHDQADQDEDPDPDQALIDQAETVLEDAGRSMAPVILAAEAEVSEDLAVKAVLAAETEDELEDAKA